MRDNYREQLSKASKKYLLKKKYGMSLEALGLMTAFQRNKCAICGDPEPSHKRLCVDHNHTTGETRALLCDGCNLVVGLSKENPATLRAAATYLESHAST